MVRYMIGISNWKSWATEMLKMLLSMNLVKFKFRKEGKVTADYVELSIDIKVPCFCLWLKYTHA